MTLKTLQRYARKISELLQVSDWEIKVGWGDPESMGNSTTLGVCQYSPEYRYAEILILHPKHRHGDNVTPSDIVDDLVHEHLHLVIHGHQAITGEDPMLERAINQISHAITVLNPCGLRKK